MGAKWIQVATSDPDYVGVLRLLDEETTRRQLYWVVRLNSLPTVPVRAISMAFTTVRQAERWATLNNSNNPGPFGTNASVYTYSLATGFWYLLSGI